MKPQTFMQAVVRHMVSKENIDDTRETVREWREAYPNDPERQAVEFGRELGKDIRHGLSPCNCQLSCDFARLGCMRVNWTHVAEYLLNRFAPLPEPDQVVFHAIIVPSSN